MLLGPQLDQCSGDPAFHALEAMQPGVAGGAEGDQGIVGVAGMAMMHDEPFRGLTIIRTASYAKVNGCRVPKSAGEWNQRLGLNQCRA